METNTTVFDAAELLERVGGDRELLAELVDLFRDDATTQSAGVEAALAAGDATALFEAAHALKGAAANFSADSVNELALELETLGRGGATEGGAAIFERLQLEIELLLRELDAFLSS